jgi:hypothetical protein
MPDIVLVDANWDVVTRYLYAFRKHLITPYLEKFNSSTHWLTGDAVVQPGVDEFLSSVDVKFLSGAGHGSFDRFKGYKNGVIWETVVNVPYLPGAIVHLLSCEAGARLGREIVARGAAAYWGYTESFRFFKKEPSPADLETDTSAAWFLTMDCLIDIGILSGQTADEIYRTVSEYVIEQSSQLGAFNLKRATLDHNFRHLVCPATYWGEREIRLAQPV